MTFVVKLTATLHVDVAGLAKAVLSMPGTRVA